jgi:hypothetical protein
LLSDVATELGYYYNSSSATNIDSDTINKPNQKLMKRLINSAYLTTIRKLPSEWFTVKRVIVLPAHYTTGTVDVVQGSTAVVGTDTSVTATMQMRQMLVSGHERPYFIRSVTDGTHWTLSTPYGGATGNNKTYKIGVWAIPLPNDFLAPLSDRDITNLENSSNIELQDKGTFRRQYPIAYSVSTPTRCCIDGITTFPEMDSSTLKTVTNGSPIIEMTTGNLLTELDIGKFMWIAGDSIKYKIIAYATPNITVSPAVQRADGSTLAYAVSPAPQPLLWFNASTATALPIEFTYRAKPSELWTDDQKVELPADWEEYWRCLSKLLIVQKFGDALQKQGILLEMQTLCENLPKHTDTRPIPLTYRDIEEWVLNIEWGKGVTA